MLYKKLYYYEQAVVTPFDFVSNVENSDSVEVCRVKTYVDEDEARALFYKGIIREELVPAFTTEEAQNEINKLNDKITMLEQHIRDLNRKGAKP